MDTPLLAGKLNVNGPTIPETLEQKEVNYDISDIMKNIPSDWTTEAVEIPEEDFQSRFEKSQHRMEKRIDDLSTNIFDLYELITPLLRKEMRKEVEVIEKEEEKPRVLGITFTIRKNQPLTVKDAYFLPVKAEKKVFLYNEGDIEWTRQMCENLNKYWDWSWFVGKDISTQNAQKMTNKTLERMDDVEKKLNKQKQIQEIVTMIVNDLPAEQTQQIALDILQLKK